MNFAQITKKNRIHNLSISTQAIAVAPLYLTMQGTAIVVAEKSRWVDVHTDRGMRYLKIVNQGIGAIMNLGKTLNPTLQ